MTAFYDLNKITALHADEYKAAISRVTDSGWFLHGKETKAFEAAYARYIGTRHCIGTGNGLDALSLILRAYKELGVMADGDEVIVPANTFIASVNAIVLNGLKPVLVEPTWEGLTIDTGRIESAVTPRTRAVMTVHLYGRLAYDDTLRNVCQRHNLRLIEDNAQGQGIRVNEGFIIQSSELNAARGFARTGSLGDAAAHSFYPGKNLGAFGDAGAVTTNDNALAETVRALGNYGSEEKYVCRYIGLNSRISEIDAAILAVKLKYLDADNNKRRKLAAFYYDNISNPLITMPKRLQDDNNVYHLFPIFCEQRNELQRHLKVAGIDTLIHYPIPPHRQQCYSQILKGSYPITERIHARELSLPMSPVVTQEEAEAIVAAVNCFGQN